LEQVEIGHDLFVIHHIWFVSPASAADHIKVNGGRITKTIYLNRKFIYILSLDHLVLYLTTAAFFDIGDIAAHQVVNLVPAHAFG
jgi:hypothetical protein